MSQARRAQQPRRGDYGIDAPYVPLLLTFAGFALFALTILNLATANYGAALGCAIGSLWFFGSAGLYLHATLRGKFTVWRAILSRARLRGDERVLDLGCGRGAILLLAAQFLTQGEAVGVDLWKTADQSGNHEDVTRHNATLEGVARRVTLQTADMRELPFPDDNFDLIVSSLAIHNIPDAPGRARAIDEAVRVLRPGGRIFIADIRATPEYAATLRQLGMADIAQRGLGWRFWYGGPWMATRLVTATKPA